MRGVKAATGAKNKTRATSKGAAVLPVTVSLPVRHGVFWRQQVLPLLIVVLGAGLRFYNLGLPPFRGGDENMFPDVLSIPGLTAAKIFVDFYKIAGEVSHMGFPIAFAKAVVDLFHLPVTEFTCRLTPAMFGSLAVLAAFYAGRVMLGRRFGLFFALFVAVNPAQIQCSREAYFYAPILLGPMMLLWSVAWCFRYRRIEVWPWKFYVASWLGVFLCAYSHYSGWWISALWGGVVAAVNVRRFRLGRPAMRECLILFGGCILICLPLLFLPWGLPWFLKLAFPSAAHLETQAKVMSAHSYNGNPLGILPLFAREAGWGGHIARSIATACFVGMGIWGLVRGRRNSLRSWVVLGVIIGGLAILHFASKASGFPPDTRYFFFAFPFFFVLVAMGIWAFPSTAAVRSWMPPFGRRLLAHVAAAFAIALLLYPAFMSTRIRSPYKDIQRWANTQPAGTLILVDRWFEPWCEMRRYSPTNAFFTFALPSEPHDPEVARNWQKSVEAFFEKYPDAFYMPLVDSYHWHSLYPPWPWPETFFRNKVVVVTIESCIRLGECGDIGFRGGVNTPTSRNRVRVPVYFNTREEILQRAKEAGKQNIVLFAPGWGYTKLWRQIRGDFRDWRVLQGAGTLDLYHLVDGPADVTVTIRAVALNGGKRVRTSTGGEFRFAQGQIMEWRIEKVAVTPGKNSLVLQDAGPSNSVLLVDDVRVE